MCVILWFSCCSSACFRPPTNVLFSMCFLKCRCVYCNAVVFCEILCFSVISDLQGRHSLFLSRSDCSVNFS